MKHKLISLAAAVCIILVAAVPGFGASACGDSPKQFVSNRAGAGFLYNIHSTGNSNNYGNGDSTNKVSQNSNISANAQGVIKLVNKERNAAGLSALTENSRLSEAAQAKAEDMMKNGYFSHISPTYGSPFEMMKTFGIAYKSAGENIAKGQKTPAAVMNGWMNSSGHRTNILNASYEQIGAGFCKDSSGVAYWVQMFIR